MTSADQLGRRDPFSVATASDIFGRPSVAVLTLVLAGVAGWVIARLALPGVAIMTVLPFTILYCAVLFRFPVVGLYSAIVFSFLLIGIGRYIPGVQVGLGMDAILILTYLALFFNRFHKKINWSPANKDITWLSLIWFAYSVAQIVNPEARSFAAWFSGRGIGTYMLLVAPLALMFINTQGKLDVLLMIWGSMSLLASLKAIVQIRFGLDAAEVAWLNDGNFKTHVLFGKLRTFSFLSDAGQFGANQAYSGIMASIMVFATRKWRRMFFLTVAVLAFYGMIISGTRGALSIPIVGLGLFFVLRKNVKVLSAGVLLLLIIIYFFKFTTIGQGNAEIRRMRTAFDPNDASLQVRLNNQRILRDYMASRPFGGGIGHGGVKAQRFLPNAYLSQIPTDSWYVLIWVEQGIVGLVLHLIILFYVLITASYRIMFRIRDSILRLKMAALASGFFGVMVASYGNAVLGQMPTNILIYISMAVLLNTAVLDKPTQTITQNKRS